MIPLRQLFLVDKLRLAASSKSAPELKIIREIIKEVKLSQLDKKMVATDAMVLGSIKKILKEKMTESRLVLQYLNESRQYISDKKDEEV